MPSVGERLRRAREARGAAIDEVARETRISARYLEALERDDLSELPASAFNRGFVRSYAIYLDLDPEEMVSAYEQEERSQTEEGRLDKKPDVLDALRATVSHPPRVGLLPFRLRAPLASAVIVLIGLIVATGWFALTRLTPSAPEIASEAAAPAATGERRTEASTKGREPSTPHAEQESERRSRSGVASRSGDSQTGAGDEREPAGAGEDAPEGRAGPELPDTAPRESSAAESEPLDPAAPEDSQASEEAESTLRVEESGVGTRIVDRSLTDSKDAFVEGDLAYFWTKVVGGRPGDSVRHVWIHDGNVVGHVDLPIGGPHWRTFSRRLLERGSAGAWLVEAHGPNDELLARHEFGCRPADETFR
jgi:cytoskeletal protein RodZ